MPPRTSTTVPATPARISSSTASTETSPPHFSAFLLSWMVMCPRLQLSQVEAFWKIFFAEKTATSATQSLYITISQRIAGIVRVAVGSSMGIRKPRLACRHHALWGGGSADFGASIHCSLPHRSTIHWACFVLSLSLLMSKTAYRVASIPVGAFAAHRMQREK